MECWSYFYRLMRDGTASIHESREDVSAFQPGITLKQCFRSIARRKHSKDMLHRQAMPADDRFAAENFRIERNPL